MNATTTGTRMVAVVGITFWVVFGAWAFASPATFYEAVATYPPFNPHFLRDAGAFMLGLGAGLAAALWRGALAAALGGSAVAAAFHVAAHVIDRHQGGSLADTLGLGALAVALAAAAAAQRRRDRR